MGIQWLWSHQNIKVIPLKLKGNANNNCYSFTTVLRHSVRVMYFFLLLLCSFRIRVHQCCCHALSSLPWNDWSISMHPATVSLQLFSLNIKWWCSAALPFHIYIYLDMLSLQCENPKWCLHHAAINLQACHAPNAFFPLFHISMASLVEWEYGWERVIAVFL